MLECQPVVDKNEIRGQRMSYVGRMDITGDTAEQSEWL